MCADFADLNMACPNDTFPLPKIDRLIVIVPWFKILSVMDAYSRYNQIKMNLL